MKKNKLTKSLLISFVIHLGVLTGIEGFLIPSPNIPEHPILIPVTTVLIEEEKEKKKSPIRLTTKEAPLLKEAVVAKAQTAMGTPSATPLEDLPGPIPKKGSFKPSLNIEQIPTPGVLPVGHEGKEVHSRRVISPSLNPPLRLPTMPPSPPDRSPILGMEETRVLTQAEKGGILVHSMKFEKTTAPLGRNCPHPEFVSDLPPIPTVQPPALPEEREMTLARQADPDSHPRNRTTPSPLKVVKPGRKIAESGWENLLPWQVASLEPLTRGFNQRRPLLGPQEGFSMLLLVDTSGSVKGPPLEGIKGSAMEFVNLLGEMDRCAVMTFDDEASLVVPFVNDKTTLRREIGRLLPQGRNTVLFDALDHAFVLLKKEKDRRRFVVLFSDGKDEGSRSTSRKVINEARVSQIAVFCLGYSRIEKRYLRTLENISQRTGGIFAEAPHFQEIVELFGAARDATSKKES